MSAQTTHIFSAAGALRMWIIGGLGALILLVIFMIQPPASASHVAFAAGQPCATSAQCQKCATCAKCAQCQKCSQCRAVTGGCMCSAAG